MRKILGTSFLAFMLFAQIVNADEPLNLDDGIAIEGFDAVGYHLNSAALKGKDEHSLDWNGAKWLFFNEENRELFAANPEKYAPEYGGFCAYAASQGYFAEIDPYAWTIKNEKLYLNYSKRVRSQWLQDVDNHIKQGDKNWPNLKKPWYAS